MKQKQTPVATKLTNNRDRYTEINTVAFLWITLIVLLFIIFGAIGCRSVKTDISKQSTTLDTSGVKKTQQTSVNSFDSAAYFARLRVQMLEAKQDSSTEVTAQFITDSAHAASGPVVVHFGTDGSITFDAPGQNLSSIKVKKKGSAQTKDSTSGQQSKTTTIKTYDSTAKQYSDSTYKTATDNSYNKNKQSSSSTLFFIIIGVVCVAAITLFIIFQNKK